MPVLRAAEVPAPCGFLIAGRYQEDIHVEDVSWRRLGVLHGHSDSTLTILLLTVSGTERRLLAGRGTIG